MASVPSVIQKNTFTTTGNGTTALAPPDTLLSRFAVQVKGTGVAPTSWTVVLEGSLDGTTFDTITTHTNTSQSDGDTITKVDGPFKAIRSRVSALSLGSATDIVVTILGVHSLGANIVSAASALTVTTASIIAEQQLAGSTLLAPAATIDINNIDQTYDDLVLRVWARGDTNATSANIALFFNNDTTAGNYRTELIAQVSTATTPTSLGSDDSVGATMPAATAPANYFGQATYEILAYAKGNNVGARCLSMYRVNNTTGLVLLDVCTHWETAGAVTRITLTPSAGNFDTGTKYQLVGRKAMTVVTGVS